ncbi:unnamed protein product, partial [Leptidea sinapis]
VRIKHQDNTVSLPKFHDSTSEREILDQNNTEKYTFKWQEKVFSQYEHDTYSDNHTCVTENDLRYHNMIKTVNCSPQRVFTYINNDCYLPLPCINNKNISDSILSGFLEKFRLKDVIASSIGETNSTANLCQSQESNALLKQEWMAMHIVYDNSKYDGDGNLIFKEDCLLLSVYFNTYSNFIILSPDVNNIVFNPYIIEDSLGVLGLEYGVDVKFGVQKCGEDLEDLLGKLYEKWKKKHKQTYSFMYPNIGKRKYYVTLEIVLAENFEMDNIYIEYYIKLPDGVECNNVLQGRTHVTKSTKTANRRWLYGHTVDLEFEVSLNDDPQPIRIFLEVISVDWWGRHRTEGYSRLSLTLAPGAHLERLSCSRPSEMNDVVAESRRFFIGGCHLLDDLNVLDSHNLQDADFKLVSTGTVLVRWSCISQTRMMRQAPLDSSAVLEGVDAVLKQYKLAKATLKAATKAVRYDTNYTDDST